jgi:hypothetical protein
MPPHIGYLCVPILSIIIIVKMLQSHLILFVALHVVFLMWICCIDHLVDYMIHIVSSNKERKFLASQLESSPIERTPYKITHTTCIYIIIVTPYI